MGVNLQEFLNNNVLGNVRTGARGEGDKILKYGYFDVHADKSTSQIAVEIFNQVYDNKPNRLKIKFDSNNPIELYLERYEGKKRRCFGNGKKAKWRNDQGKIELIGCDAKTCVYRENRKCKYRGRLYFRIEKIEIEGIWCYPIGSEKGIRNICNYIIHEINNNIDITKEWYEVFLREEDAPVKGKNYIPDIRRITANFKELPKGSKNDTKLLNSNNVNQTTKNYLKILAIGKVKIENNDLTKIKFLNTSAKEVELIISNEANQDIVKLKPESIVLPINIKSKGNLSYLFDYKIIRDFEKENKDKLNKKAV